MKFSRRRAVGVGIVTAAAVGGGRRRADAHAPPAIRFRTRSTAAYTKYKDLQGGQERRLHPGAREGRSEAVRHRARDGRRSGLHGRRRHVRGLDPVDLEGVHDGARAPGSGEAAIANNIGVDATGQAFNSIVAIEQYKGKEMNPLVNAGAIATTSMVRGATREEVWKHDHRARYDAFAGRKLDGEPGGLQVRGGDEPAQPGDRRS